MNRLKKHRSLIDNPNFTNGLLRRKSGHGNHTQSPVLNLRQLHAHLPFLIGGIEIQGIESIISGKVVIIIVFLGDFDVGVAGALYSSEIDCGVLQICLFLGCNPKSLVAILAPLSMKTKH